MTATRKYPKPSDKNINLLTASQRNLLVRTALHVITEKIPPFKMDYYCHVPERGSMEVYEVGPAVNECGASCCLMGLAAFIEFKSSNTDVSANESWSEFGRRALGVYNGYEMNGEFMFSGNWDNNRKQAASRVLLWLRGQDQGTSHLEMRFNPSINRYSLEETYLTSYSTAKLMRELKKFLVEE